MLQDAILSNSFAIILSCMQYLLEYSRVRGKHWNVVLTINKKTNIATERWLPQPMGTQQ